MVFKKPYAFFIKYFKVINLILTIFLLLIIYKMYSLNGILNQIYEATVTNYSSLNSTYLGFSMYLLMFLEIVFLTLVIILLKRKDKPFRDYLLGILYLIILFIFFLSVSNLFFTLEGTIIEPASLKVYSDLSFLLMLPSIYLILRYLMITIGFDLKKFNFSKDIIELKSEDDDNEEVELMFAKDSYKYKRSLRRYIRELKYYVIENKLFIYIIFGVIGIALLTTFAGFKIFNSSSVKIKETFVAGTFSYNVLNVYETKYDLHGSLIKDGYKFVVANVNVRNNSLENSTIDYKKIRLFYGKEYVYASNYYNNYLNDLGDPYNNYSLLQMESKNHIFIFKVPDSYKSNKYTLKFYNRNFFEEEELNADYKVLNVKAKNLDKKVNKSEYKINDTVIFNEKQYGASNFVLKSHQITQSYNYKEGEFTRVVIPKNSNSSLFILEYLLNLDKNNNFIKNFKNDNDFIKTFMKISYELNGDIKSINNENILKVGVNNRIIINVPYNFNDANNIKVSIKFRDFEYIYIVN